MSAESDQVNKLVAELGEHYDTVQVFVTRHESGEQRGTVHAEAGLGNWYARYGQIKEWVVRQESRAGCEAVKEEDDTE